MSLYLARRHLRGTAQQRQIQTQIAARRYALKRSPAVSPDEIELMCAQRVLEVAQQSSTFHSRPGDREMAALAILYRAIELATPGSTPAMRAQPLLGDA